MSTLTHMPYLDGNTLIFCVSAGVGTFHPQQSHFEVQRKIPPSPTTYQQWTPAVKVGNADAVRIQMPYPMDTPNRVYCNPVLNGTEMSVCYNRALFAGTLANYTFTNFKMLYSGIFTGYKLGTMLVIGKVRCAGGSQVITNDGKTSATINTVFDHILRIVPYKTGNIITGQQDGKFYTVYLNGDVAERLTVNGKDIYKGYLTDDGSMVIHAVRGGGFEERSLRSDSVVLVPMTEFIRPK